MIIFCRLYGQSRICLDVVLSTVPDQFMYQEEQFSPDRLWSFANTLLKEMLQQDSFLTLLLDVHTKKAQVARKFSLTCSFAA